MPYVTKVSNVAHMSLVYQYFEGFLNRCCSVFCVSTKYMQDRYLRGGTILKPKKEVLVHSLNTMGNINSA